MCGVRRNHAGKLVAEAYGLISSAGLDPVEKKPLYHFFPGRKIFSIGSGGCNFRCGFCQNWEISQSLPSLQKASPAEAVQTAKRQKACGMAYTYNEPLINIEYILDCARAARAAGLVNAVVTNGSINPEPLAQLRPWIDAWNIDVKSMREEFYHRVCGGRLQPVLETVKTVALGGAAEVTYLIVTGENDSEHEIREFIDWVASVSPEIPVHFSRYFPQYRWEAPPTDPAVLQRAADWARRKLAWVYLGNVAGRDDSTYCPRCGELLIERSGYQTGKINVRGNQCPKCRRTVPGRF